MQKALAEMKNSWLHCKDLLQSQASLDLVVSFLEDFKVQFTEFYQQLKTQGSSQQIAYLVDKAFLLWKREGEISRFIVFVKNNWEKKDELLKKIDKLDSLITRCVRQYTLA